MANPTTYFGWVMPTATDLVTDLPADFNVFGQGVDTSLQDLLGGTTGQVLKKNSNTDMDFVWGADSAGMTNPMTTTGDTIYSSSGSTPARLAIGSTGNVLTVAGGVPTWAAPASGGMTVLASGSLSGTEVSLTSISGSYNNLQLIIKGFNPSASDVLFLRINNDSGSVYSGRSATATAGAFGNTAIIASPAQYGGGTSRYLGIFTIPEYTNTTTWKTVNCWSMTNGDGSGAVSYSNQTAATNQTAAVTSIQIRTENSSTFNAGTYILYGVK
jgi:hypothetical protein